MLVAANLHSELLLKIDTIPILCSNWQSQVEADSQLSVNKPIAKIFFN